MNEKKYTKLEKGSFLIASPETSDKLYERSVVLICEHTPAGSFGLMLNKPFALDLPPDMMGLEELANPHVQLRVGGKMQQTQMMLLHGSNSQSCQTLQILDEVFLGGDLGFLQEMLAQSSPPPILLCLGYTGWVSGELEKEFMQGLWFVTPGTKEHVFKTPPKDLWQTLLKNMGGKYASIAAIPEDLTLN